MVVSYHLSGDASLEHHIAVLRQCIAVLRRRVAEETSHSWVWRAKLKAALFGMLTLEGQRLRTDSVQNVVLDHDEIHELAGTHPLLQDDRPTPSSLRLREEMEWYRKLQERVQQFARGTQLDTE